MFFFLREKRNFIFNIFFKSGKIFIKSRFISSFLPSFYIYMLLVDLTPVLLLTFARYSEKCFRYRIKITFPTVSLSEPSNLLDVTFFSYLYRHSRLSSVTNRIIIFENITASFRIIIHSSPLPFSLFFV